jgi:acyl-CoA synthetase (AMP-forming)/AMP-acid ligase II
MEWVMQPALFLESVGPERATLCWLPNFAFSFMASRVKASPKVDLRCLRAAINCSEPVRAESMDAFALAFAGCGLRAEAMQASYAMAESTFAVTQTRLGKTPPRLSISRAAFGKGRLEQASKDAREIVSSGVPIRGAELRIVDDQGSDVEAGRIGEILVRGPFVMDDYLTAPGTPEDVETAASSVSGIHAGRSVALGIDDASIGTQRLVVVSEVDDASMLERSDELERDVRAAVMAMCGVAPGAVFLVPPKWIVKSTAGKTSRVETRARLISSWGELNRDGRVAFSPPNGDA